MVANRGDLRWPLPTDFVKRLKGKTVSGLGRRAKYLLADLSSGEVLVMHLGMSGSFRVELDDGETVAGNYYHDRSKDMAHDHVVFRMSSGATIRFNDPRRFGSMKIVPRDKLDEEPLLRALGPEPLGNEFSAALLAQACQGKNTSLKAALLDQTLVAGLGNIYVCEALNRALHFAEAQSLHHRDAKGRADRARGKTRRRDQDRAERSHQGRRLVAARPSPHRRLARRFPAQLPGL